MGEQSPAASMLAEAALIVDGARQQTHGERERSFELIATYWTVYLTGRKDQGPLRPVDVALMMDLLKTARAQAGEPQRDHFVDKAGYAALAGELAL